VTNKAEWKKVEAGQYVHTTDDGYTADVENIGYSWYLESQCWVPDAASPTGRGTYHSNRDDARSGERTMAKAKRVALEQIQDLRVLDEIERLTEQLRSNARHTMNIDAGITMGSTKFHPNGNAIDTDKQGSFHLHGDHHTYKVTVELDNG